MAQLLLDAAVYAFLAALVLTGLTALCCVVMAGRSSRHEERCTEEQPIYHGPWCSMGCICVGHAPEKIDA